MVLVFYFLLFLVACSGICVENHATPTVQPNVTLSEIEQSTQAVDHLGLILYGDDERLSFTLSELQRTAIDGQPMTMREWVTHWLVYLDAKRAGISYSDEEIDKGLNDLQRNNDYSIEMLKNVFKAAGYLWDDVRTHYGAMQVIRTKMEMEMLGNQRELNTISEEKAMEYYKKNPVFQEAICSLQTGAVPLDPSRPESDQIAFITQELKKNNAVTLEWQEPFDLKESELPENSPWFKLNAGDFLPPKVRDQEIEVKRLVSKDPAHYVSFEEREDEIKQVLRQQKIKQFIDAYHDRLLSEAIAQGRIKFLDDAIKKAVLDNKIFEQKD